MRNQRPLTKRKPAARWTLGLLGGLAAALLAFAVVNLLLNLSLFIATDASSRIIGDARRLAAAGPWEDFDSRAKFNRLYAEKIGRDASDAEVLAYFRAAFAGRRPVIFDQVQAGYALARHGQVDARTLPPGVYIGTRAIGPDDPPMVAATKYLANYAFFVRHSFVLVVPSPYPDGSYGRSVSFGAGLKSDFVSGSETEGRALYATLHPYHLGGFDFPNEGQAIHELYALSFDPAVIAAAPARLEGAASAIQAAGMAYRPVTRNSNSVVGCLLRASGALEGREETAMNDWQLGLRALGIDFDLPLRASLPDPAAFPRLARDCHD